MAKADIQTIFELMKSEDPAEVRKAVAKISGMIDDIEPGLVPDVVEVLTSLFYIDLGDKPDWVTVVEDTVSVIASFGEGAVPTLVWLLGESDYKANLMMARALGRIGPPAYGHLKDLFYNPPTPWHRSLSMFALAKMHEAALMEIFPDTVTALDDSDREIRDTAARTIGRILDSFQPGQIPQDLANHAFERLLFRFRDSSAVVRSKAVRSIGKMARNGYLDHDMLAAAIIAVNKLLGIGEDDPDPFYLVRKEAENTKHALEALQRALGY